MTKTNKTETLADIKRAKRYLSRLKRIVDSAEKMDRTIRNGLFFTGGQSPMTHGSLQDVKSTIILSLEKILSVDSAINAAESTIETAMEEFRFESMTKEQQENELKTTR